MSKKEELLAKLAKLPPEKRAFLEKQLMSKAVSGITRRPEQEPALLSFAQQRLWFLEQLEPGLPTYSMPFLAKLEGRLQVEVLERCLQEILERHEVLRTTYTAVNGEPRQEVQPLMPLQLEVTDLRAMSASERSTIANREQAAEAALPFDLEKGPLLRAHLWQLEDETYDLLVCLHHIAGDGWSTGVLIRELAALYKAFSQGQPSPLPPLEIQYADFAYWQHKYLQDAVLAKQLEYWKKQLGGELPVLGLPYDKQRPSKPSYRGARLPIQISRDLTERLKQFSQEEGVTLFMTLLAVYNVLLYRYTGQDDLLVGTPVANRNQADIQPLVGFFVNTLVLRSSLSGSMSFQELVQQVRKMCLDAFANQEVPFEKLVAELVSERNLSHSVLFQTLFSLNPSVDQSLDLSDLKLTSSNLDTGTSKFDLSLELFEGTFGVKGTFEFSTELFEAGTIERMNRQFLQLLERIVDDPKRSISEYAMMTEEETALLCAWNDNHHDYPTELCIHQLFEAQVQKTPDATALVFDTQRFTYRELNQRANQVAHYLQQQGVGPEVFVGVCMERSPEMVIAMLGILKAGGAYVPLDPNYPSDRIQFMMEDAQAPVLLTQQKLASTFADQHSKVVSLDTEWAELFAGQLEDNLTSAVTSRNLSYVIYTSGSTGKPKGVAIEHRSVNVLIHWAKDTYTQDEMAGVLFSTSICFDLSVYELFVTLAMGGSVILVENALHLPQAPAAQEVTLINTVPSAIAELLKMNAIPESVRVVNLAGEPLKQVIVQELYDLPHLEKVYNLYGPSEDTTYSTVALMSRDSEQKPLIGVPIHNTQAYLLDQNLRPVPVGVTGELYLGGDGLARGYLHRPDLTEERFIPNPFVQEEGARMYKTGDLARFLPDGQLDYQGRIDHQVKVRGFRIELGEIEAKLSKHPDVREVTVMAREDQPGLKLLVAYLSAMPSKELNQTELRTYLKEFLPEYMVPSVFVILDTLPLTPNGKVDRKALPVPDRTEDTRVEYMEPRTATEKIIANIWAEVLGLEKVGLADNFFERGGHSLIATRAISRLNAEFGLKIPLHSLFEAQTVAELAVSIEQMQQAGQKAVESPILAVSREVGALSFAQQRLWVLDQLMPGQAAYNMPFAVRLQGELQQEVLQKALNEIIKRHESLRTTFAEEEGQPLQVINAAEWLELPLVDVSGMPEEQREAEMKRLFHVEAETPFDLSRGPLVRFSLVKLATAEHVLIFNMHHIVSDGWSIGVLIDEFAKLYEAFVNGQPSPLADLPIQYADFAAWQRDWLQGGVLEEQLAYWKQQLAGELPVLQLPTDRGRSPMQTYRGAVERFELSQELTKAVNKLSQQQGVTPFMTLLAAFQTFLARYSGQDDICVGTPIAGRKLKETEGLIGFFVNTLVLRTDLSGNPTFRELLGRVRKTALDAYANQDVPFEKLVEEIQPERARNRSPLFQVMFILQNTPINELQLPGLSVQPLQHESTMSKFDLSLSLRAEGESMIGHFEYNTDLFDSTTIGRMIGHFARLLEALTTEADRSIYELPMISETERQQYLQQWAESAGEFAADLCPHQLFEMQAARHPHNVAVVYEDQSLTYSELNAQANRLARYLRKHGVQQGMLVGLSTERSIEMIVGLLGILKAGCAYVPLDPTYPSDRLAFMMEDSQVPVVVTQQHLMEQLPAQGTTYICFDRDAALIAQEEEGDLDNLSTLESTAYVIYTSGSTGKPKGVLVPHRNVTRLFTATEHWYGFDERDVWTLFHSYAFDFSVWEIWGALLYGGKLVVVPYLVSRSPEAFYNLLVQEQVTVLNQTPSAFYQLIIEESNRAQAAELALRYVIFGGEALELQSLKPWFAKHGDQTPQLVNMYGITETTVHVTYRPIGLNDLQQGSGSVIGVPIPDLQVYVLDAHREPVPYGVAGEMYVGGAGVANGYLNRPELTAERFIQNPFSDDASDRLYKTGDLARMLPTGDLEYLGRIDQQVKIRGFRIELGEIETALALHPDVMHSAVTVHTDHLGHKNLIAYVVLAKQSEVSVQDLRNALAESLPSYMIPAVFVMLDSMPLTPNGKVDRKALPVPDRAVETGVEYVEPRTATEKIIADVWAEVLDLEKVGLADNFFARGGHSLIATRAISRLSAEFGLKIPLQSLFEAQTVEELAVAIEQMQQAGQKAVESPILPVSREVELPLSFAQQRLWVLDQLMPGQAVYNMPFAVRLQGELHQEVLQKALNEIIKRHESLRTTFVEEQGQPLQVITASEWLELPMVDVSGLPGETREAEMKRLFHVEAETPFDLSRGPLVRYSLVKLASDEHVLIFNMHHIVSDGWSIGVMIDEFAQLYEAFVNDQPSPLTDLPIQYADFAVWQRDWLQGGVLEEQMTYWKQQLAGELPVLQLPTDRGRPPVQTYRGAVERFELTNELTEAVNKLSQQQGVTPFMTLLAAFQTLLARYSGLEDICVGTPIAGRKFKETEGLIGFFVNTLVMRTDLSGNPTFRELLRRVRQTALDAYANQDVPFEKLVEEIQPEREMDRSPLFQVMFILQNVPMQAPALPGLTLNILESENETAKFDLTLSMIEKDGRLAGSLEYNVDLFDATTIQRIAQHFQTLLESILANVERSVADLPILPQAEWAMLESWNDNRLEQTEALCIHQWFERQVARTPDAKALVFADQVLTYRELNERANQVAHRLQKCGIQPESFVGVCMERTPELVVALLGVLKSGGAYVPLDPKYPQDRIQFMLEDAQANVLLTQAHLVGEFSELLAGRQVLCLDTEWTSAFAGEQNTNLSSDVQMHNLGYVIYTSGSTGKPKGVAIEHRNVNALIHWAKETFTPAEMAGVLFSTSICFDLSVFELFVTFAMGGHVIVVENALHLPQAPAAQEVTLINTVPSAIAELLKMNAIPESVRVVNLAGEPLKQVIVQELYELPHLEKVYNLYGPSEDTTYSTFALMARDSEQKPLIGVPIHNTQAYLLDQNLRPVPIGVTGELYLGGAGLARGYLHRPDLTEERFIPNLFAQESGARLYKTGDLARFLPNGQLDYQGRIDHQVKVRGFRIELGEIEAKLSKLPAVRESVVIAREDERGDQSLIAYLAPHENCTLEAKDLRLALKEVLPAYMVPSAFVVLEALPLTPNGKVDRKALPAPDASVWQDDQHVEPRTPLETGIAAIWAEILGSQDVGVETNFFEIGGHSLLATRVISHLNAAYAVQVPLKAFFEAPTVAGLAASVERLQGESHHDTREQAPALTRISREQPLQLSFAQQRLWLLDQILQEDGTAYHIPAAVRLHGKLDTGALHRALDEIITRHEVLRTSFVEKDGEPVLEIAETATATLQQVDLSSFAEVEREAEVLRHFQKETQQAFDLSKGPLVRFLLLQVAADEHVLVLNFHHIVFDGWSLSVFIREFVQLYGAIVTGHESPLAPLPIQYADYAAWHRQWLEGEALHQQMGYWQQQLADLPVLQLPTDSPRPIVQTYNGATEDFVLSRELTDKLQTLGQAHGATLFMTLLAAFQTLLYRYSGQEDFAVGTPIAGRSRLEVEDLIGFFVNTLVLRSDLSGAPTFVELLGRVRETALQAYAHQDIPFERLVEAVQPERDLSRSPLFQVMFILQNLPSAMSSIADLQIEHMKIENGSSKFDFTLSMTEQAQGLVGSLEYNVDLYHAPTIKRMIGHFAMLLESIVADPKRTILEHSMMTEEDLTQLRAWNDNQREYPTERCIHQFFEAQVQKTPEAIALVFDHHRFTYRELNQRANQVAHYLQHLGVGPEVFVGVCMDRSPEMVIAMLGILKAGGAYVPLDPNYPSDRIQFMMEDAQAPVLLTQQKWAASFADQQMKVLSLDTDWEALFAGQPDENVVSAVTSRNLLYVIYTSGSTGKPKGVAIEHRNVNALIHWAKETFTPAEMAGVLFSTSICFDLSVFELFVTFAMGGYVILVENALHLPQAPAAQEVTLINTVPSAIAELLKMNAIPDSVRVVNLAGEALKQVMVQELYELPHLEKVYNLYGPSEDTTYSTFALMARDSEQKPLIGVPIHNTQAYLLDQNLRPVPIGVTGELYLGGAGLARGYLHRPDLTEERFIPNPFAQEAGARLYKTGDLARFLPDGQLDYQGRIDHQVKVRGFRIELGEIEAKLSKLPEVRDAVVIASEDVRGDKRLVAYVAPEENHMLDVRNLRIALKEVLPEYMVPSVFVVLDALPLTPNGKVDRKALPTPTDDPNAAQLAFSYKAPRDLLEWKLTRIWEEVLGVPQVGVTDNFFDRGGHSLSGMRLISKIEKQWGQKLPIAALFKAPTIEQLATWMRTEDSSANHSTLVEIQPHGTQRPLFFIHPIGGHVLSYADLARELGAEQPFYGLQAPGLEDDRAPLADVVELAALYRQEIQNVQPEGPYRIGGWSFGGVVAFELAQQLQRAGHVVEPLILLDTFAPVAANAHLLGQEADDLADFAYDLLSRHGKALPDGAAQEFASLQTEAERLDYLIEQLQQMELLPVEIGREHVQRQINVFRSHRNAYRTYSPSVYEGTIQLIRVKEADDKAFGWGELASDVQVTVLPATHFSLMQTPHTSTVAQLIHAHQKQEQSRLLNH